MDALTALVAEIRQLCRPGQDEDYDADLAHILACTDALPEPQAAACEDNPAVDRYLAVALAAAEAGPAAALARALGKTAALLPWRYSYGGQFAELRERVAFAELMGSRGPLPSDRLNLGFTLIGPDTFYPAHRHPAIELYLVVAGVALWTRGADTRARKPGDFILHDSNVAHAMRTEAEPLLALYAWRGDLASPSVYV